MDFEDIQREVRENQMQEENRRKEERRRSEEEERRRQNQGDEPLGSWLPWPFN